MRVLIVALSTIAICTAGLPALSQSDGTPKKADTAAATLCQEAAGLVTQNQLDQAFAKYSQAIDADPKLATAWAGRASVKELQGKIHSALQDYNKAIELDAKNADFYAQRALVNYALGVQIAADKDVATALKLDPKNDLALKAKKKVSRTIGSGDKKESKTTTSSKNARAAAAKAFAEGMAAEQNGNLQDAMKKYTEAIKFDSTFPYPYQKRGQARLDLKDLKGARADLDKAISLAPDNPDTYAQRALLERQEGNFEDAVTNMNFAVKLAPNEANYYVQRALMFVDKKDYENGRKDLSKALELNPKNGLALTMKKKLDDMKKTK